MDKSHRRVLLLYPSTRTANALSYFGETIQCQIIKDDRAHGSFISNFRYGRSLDILDLIETRIALYANNKIHGVTCAAAFPGMNVAAACIAQELGLPGPSPQAILTCEHKYYSREAQKKYVPDATAQYQLFDPRDTSAIDNVSEFPRFLKPVKSILSTGAFKIRTKEDLRAALSTQSLPEDFLIPFNQLIARYTDFEFDANYYLLEELLEGWQVSLEGYVYNGEVTVMGVVDAVMFPGTISFRRFQYPSCLSDPVQQRMSDIAQRFISGIKYDNWAFNIEMMYNPVTERIQIIEVNARLASQFWDLFEMVDGSNPFDVILKLALGEKPTFTKRQGRFKVAGSCVLRTFEDKLVLSIPTKDDIEKLKQKYPDANIEVLAKRGKRLSEQLQDTDSFRFGLVNIGAGSYEELESKFEDCLTMLPYAFDTAKVLDT